MGLPGYRRAAGGDTKPGIQGIPSPLRRRGPVSVRPRSIAFFHQGGGQEGGRRRDDTCRKRGVEGPEPYLLLPLKNRYRS